jgi:hypothetical protein
MMAADRARPLEEETAQIGIAALRDASECGLAAGGIVPPDVFVPTVSHANSRYLSTPRAIATCAGWALRSWLEHAALDSTVTVSSLAIEASHFI